MVEEVNYDTCRSNILIGFMDISDSVCEGCGGVPPKDWLPFWVYDEFSVCECNDAEVEGDRG